jgi:uncharacterized protein YbaP (TraB family)
MIRRWFAPMLIAPLLVAAVLPSCAVADAPRPLLWKVSDADNEVYLLGSFHLLKPADYPLAASTDAAFADAERLVFEMSPAETNSPTLAQRFAQAAQRSDGRTLQESLPPALWAQLEAQVQKQGGSAQTLQQLDAWYVGLVLALGEMQKLGLDPSHGLDQHFIGRAVEAGKATAGLETGDQQIQLFDGMSAADQAASLEDTLGEVAELRTRIEQMHALWRAGDADGLAKITLDELRAEYPQLYARMNRDRNRAWLPVLQRLLDDSRGDDALVVVGSMHLLGDDGLVELLRAKGYTVERL